jgi:hypothetical protein
MTLIPLNGHDGSWDALKADWAAQCKQFEEDLASYAPGTMAELEGLALGEAQARAGVFGLKLDGKYAAICQLNVTPLPGYEGPVLRLRFMTLSMPLFWLGFLRVFSTFRKRR